MSRRLRAIYRVPGRVIPPPNLTPKKEPEMGNALQGLLDAVAGVLGGLSPVAKAIVAAVLPLLSSLLNMILAGSFDVTSLVVLATGAVTALGVYLLPNKAKPTLSGGAGSNAAPPVPAPAPGPTPPPVPPMHG